MVPKGYCSDMMTLIELVVLRTPTYCRKQSVSLNATKDEYIATEKKASKDSSSIEEYDLENYTDEDEDYTLIHFIIG